MVAVVVGYRSPATVIFTSEGMILEIPVDLVSAGQPSAELQVLVQSIPDNSSKKSCKVIYCKTGNVNEQVMLTNLTSGMGSLIFLPRQQLYPINNYIP